MRNASFDKFTELMLKADDAFMQDLTPERAASLSRTGSSIKIELKDGSELRLPLRNKLFAGSIVIIGENPSNGELLRPSDTGERAEKRAKILNSIEEKAVQSDYRYYPCGTARLVLRRLDATSRGQNVPVFVRLEDEIWVLTEVRLSWKELSQQLSKRDTQSVHARVDECLDLFIEG